MPSSAKGSGFNYLLGKQEARENGTRQRGWEVQTVGVIRSITNRLFPVEVKRATEAGFEGASQKSNRKCTLTSLHPLHHMRTLNWTY